MSDSKKGYWRVKLAFTFIMLAVAGVLATAIRVVTVSRTYAQLATSQLATPAVEALAGEPVRIEDLAQIQELLTHRNQEFRDMLMRRGVTKEQIDGFRYGRYKLVTE